MSLNELYKIFTSSKHSQWIIDAQDVDRLVKVVQLIDAKEILECGTGIGASTAVLAYATKGKVTTLEQYDKCIKIAKELIPQELQGKIEFVKSDPEVYSIPEIKYHYFSAYKEIPFKMYDLVFIDGPSPFLEEESLVNLPNGDIFTLLNNIKPGGYVYVDGRREAVKLMDRHLFPFLEKINQASKFTLYQRTDKIFDKAGDLAHDNLKLGGYFENL